MDRRAFLAGLAGSAAAGGAQRTARRPNILFIMADDHASHAIGAYGSMINKTPNLDRIATAGARLNNCFCTNSICTPSRGAILTGQYSHKNGVKTLQDPLDPARSNVAKLLRDGGYQTAMIGKWHLHNDPSGFDFWRILPGQGLYHNPVFLEAGQKKEYSGYCTDLITDFSIDWLKRRDAEKPFFLMCHHKAPHRPWDPDEKYSRMFAGVDVPEPPTLYDHYENRSQAAKNATLKVGENMNKRDLKQEIPPDLKGDALRKWAYQIYIKDYLRCVASVDENVGRLLDFLDEEKLTDNTLVIYTSDQGFFLGDHGYFDKRFMYEESLRMPFLARLPGAIRPGTTPNEMVLNIDFAPLFLDYAGLSTPGDMQGRSCRAVLEGRHPRNWRSSFYYRYWMHLADHGVPAHYGVRTDRFKLIYYYGQALGSSGAIDKPTPPEWEMFDLRKDPRELRNVYNDAAYASDVRKLKAELARLQQEVGDQAVE